jgi:hypothetical protein
VPVLVPEKVGRYSAAARQFRDHTQRHEVSRALLPRATRIVHLIAVEAERRGWSARASSESKNGYDRIDWTGTKDGHLQITAEQYEFWLRLQEEGVHTRGVWEEEVYRYRNVSSDWSFYRDRQLPRGPYDAGANGRFKLELYSSGRWTYSGANHAGATGSPGRSRSACRTSFARSRSASSRPTMQPNERGSQLRKRQKRPGKQPKNGNAPGTS